MSKRWKVYLAGEIHSDWRDRIVSAASERGLPVSFTAPVTDHAASDNCGVDMLGPEASSFWKDHKGAKINAIRTRTLIGDADVVVVRFGGDYRQWNAAFDAGFAAALGKPIIVIHDAGIAHALKEVDSAALAVAETPEQAVDVLTYAIRET
ncbi:MAG: YtoQ family protein [Gemmatimonadota bacterium]|nr:YtoQ family protein [Gemmatimonadota bacterium]